MRMKRPMVEMDVTLRVIGDPSHLSKHSSWSTRGFDDVLEPLRESLKTAALPLRQAEVRSIILDFLGDRIMASKQQQQQQSAL